MAELDFLLRSESRLLEREFHRCLKIGAARRTVGSTASTEAHSGHAKEITEDVLKMAEDVLGIAEPRKSAPLKPGMTVGFTDARVHRDLGAVAYGAGLFSPSLSTADYGTRFHGNNERIDVESLTLTTQLWLDVIHDLLPA